MNDDIATLGGGCFWCVEAVLRRVRGVKDVTPGYSGGRTEDPTYEEVCSGTTGHIEVAQVRFDPSVVSYQDLLRIFFSMHDPTSRDRQGDDVGEQYRSVLFTHSDDQRRVVDEVIHELEKDVFEAPIVTDVREAPVFYPAEDYHRDYFARNPHKPYCAAVIAPKVAKLRASYEDFLEESVA